MEVGAEVGGIGCVRERVSVVKFASRTFSVTVLDR